MVDVSAELGRQSIGCSLDATISVRIEPEIPLWWRHDVPTEPILEYLIDMPEEVSGA